MSEVIVLVTGGFDPIHSGHIAYLKDAKKLGDKLIVGVNSDQWLVQKKGSPFLPIEERIEIVSNLSVVDKAIEFTDDELNSASGAIQKVIDQYPDNKIIFANGGDRTSDNIPEMEKFKNNKNKNLYNLDKFNSYHYEIMNTSNLLINREIFENNNLDVSLKKIENKIKLLSDWFEY